VGAAAALAAAAAATIPVGVEGVARPRIVNHRATRTSSPDFARATGLHFGGVRHEVAAAVADDWEPTEPTPIPTGEWVRGLLFVVIVTALGVGLAIWVLVSFVFQCGCTAPA
jgi:hypothetical protein